MRRKRVLILYGGYSYERDVSKSSAENVYKALLKDGAYELYKEEFNAEKIFGILQNVRPDVVFNAMHGTYGEDGALQGLLEILSIPYTHSGMRSSALSMNKAAVFQIVKMNGVRVPEFIECKATDCLNNIHNKGLHPMSFPYVIKPIAQGSSIGVFIVKEKDDARALPRASEWLYGDRMLVDRYIPGQEISCAVVFERACGVIELIPPQDRFYDYETKYAPGVTHHIMPANIPSFVYERAMQISEKIHKMLGCSVLSRCDFRYNANEDDGVVNNLNLGVSNVLHDEGVGDARYSLQNSKRNCALDEMQEGGDKSHMSSGVKDVMIHNSVTHNSDLVSSNVQSDGDDSVFAGCGEVAKGLYFLEINTHPGLTELSLVPEIAAYGGISFIEILHYLIQNAKCELSVERKLS